MLRPISLRRPRRMNPIIALALAGLLLSCAPRLDNHGNTVDLDNLVEIEPGKTRKTRVSALLGAPSTRSDYGQDTWIYIGSKTKTVAFFQPEVVNRRVVYITFGADGVVNSIGKLSDADGKKIEFVSRQTPTSGQRITLLQQLLGNVGRFSGASAD
jgi:outer membrane protein assembly factor BamE (lipoprotein component of BamABCDE complex)